MTHLLMGVERSLKVQGEAAGQLSRFSSEAGALQVMGGVELMVSPDGTDLQGKVEGCSSSFA